MPINCTLAMDPRPHSNEIFLLGILTFIENSFASLAHGSQFELSISYTSDTIRKKCLHACLYTKPESRQQLLEELIIPCFVLKSLRRFCKVSHCRTQTPNVLWISNQATCPVVQLWTHIVYSGTFSHTATQLNRTKLKFLENKTAPPLSVKVQSVQTEEECARTPERLT